MLEAETLAQAIELVRSEPIDVVLLDMHVGEDHGFELLPYLRESRPEAAVCLLSGTTESDPVQVDGVHAFIRKPFELEDLTEHGAAPARARARTALSSISGAIFVARV